MTPAAIAKQIARNKCLSRGIQNAIAAPRHVLMPAAMTRNPLLPLKQIPIHKLRLKTQKGHLMVETRITQIPKV